MPESQRNNQSATRELIYGSLQSVKRLGMLYAESAKLKVTDKITILLSYMAFVGVILALAIVCLVFISIGIGHLLATTIAPHLAYLIIAAFYVLLFFLMVIMKRRWFVDPICRFMSRLLVEVPEDEREKEIIGEESILPSTFEDSDSQNVKPIKNQGHEHRES